MPNKTDIEQQLQTAFTLWVAAVFFTRITITLSWVCLLGYIGAPGWLWAVSILCTIASWSEFLLWIGMQLTIRKNQAMGESSEK